MTDWTDDELRGIITAEWVQTETAKALAAALLSARAERDEWRRREKAHGNTEALAFRSQAETFGVRQERDAWKRRAEEAETKLRDEEAAHVDTAAAGLRGSLAPPCPHCDALAVQNEALREALKEARSALDSPWAAIGDALMSGKGIAKPYVEQVASEVRNAVDRAIAALALDLLRAEKIAQAATQVCGTVERWADAHDPTEAEIEQKGVFDALAALQKAKEGR